MRSLTRRNPNVRRRPRAPPRCPPPGVAARRGSRPGEPLDLPRRVAGPQVPLQDREGVVRPHGTGTDRVPDERREPHGRQERLRGDPERLDDLPVQDPDRQVGVPGQVRRPHQTALLDDAAQHRGERLQRRADRRAARRAPPGPRRGRAAASASRPCPSAVAHSSSTLGTEHRGHRDGLVGGRVHAHPRERHRVELGAEADRRTALLADERPVGEPADTAAVGGPHLRRAGRCGRLRYRRRRSRARARPAAAPHARRRPAGSRTTQRCSTIPCALGGGA